MTKDKLLQESINVLKEINKTILSLPTMWTEKDLLKIISKCNTLVCEKLFQIEYLDKTKTNTHIEISTELIDSQKEQAQQDILCILDGLDSTVLDNVCQVIVDRFNILKGITNEHRFNKPNFRSKRQSGTRYI